MTKEQFIKQLLNDLRIEFAGEFDLNFRHQSFFGTPWAARKSPLRPTSAGILSGRHLRTSLRSRLSGSSIIFTTPQKYAAIHNSGGRIRITAKMKSYFWARYYEAVGSIRHKKDGSASKSKANLRRSTIAEFWQGMALKKVGSYINIPQRQYIGSHPRLITMAEETISCAIKDYLNTIQTQFKKQ